MSACINKTIISKTVRLISSDSKNLGLMSTTKALDMAMDEGLDLVQISDGDEPTCKILDYQKHVYEQKKLKKKNKKNTVENKELQFRPNTDVNDIERLIKKAQKFIDAGNNVKFIVRFKGREVTFNDNVIASFDKITKSLVLPKLYKISNDVVVKGNRMGLYVTRG